MFLTKYQNVYRNKYGFLKRITLWVKLVEQELITLSEYPFSTTLKNLGPGGSMS
jgi:hypothetical protein